MNKLRLSILKLATIVFGLGMSFSANSQNAIVGSGFSTGWGGGSCPTGNSNFTYLTTGAGGTFVSGSLTPGGTGNQYFRMGIDWGGTTAQRTITLGSDVAVSPGTKYTLNSNCTTSGAMFTNVSSTLDRYVFKTINAGTNPTGTFVFFAIQGAVRTFTSHTAPTSATAFANSTVRLTVTLSDVLNSGQSAYIRYHNGAGFGSATISELTQLSGSNYYIDIPAGTNTFGSTVTYYFFTSGSGLTISNTDADLYSINLLNNTGSNYSYTVNTFTTTGSGGNWSSTGTWLGGVAPSTGSNVTLQHDVTLDADVNLASLTINSGINFTASDASPRNLTLTRSASGSATTLTNSGTWNNGTGGSTLTLSGAPSSGDAIHALSGTFNLNNVTISKTSGSNNVGANFGASCKLASGGKLTIGNGGYISSGGIASDFYTGNGNTTLEFSNPGGYVVQPGDATWPSTNSPASITISGSSTVTLNTARTLTSTLTVNSGSTFNSGGNLTITGPGRIGNSGGTIGGNINLEISMSSGRRAFRLLSFPFSTARSLADISDDIHVTGTGGATNGFDATTTNASSAFTFTESGFNGTTNTGWSGIASTSTSIPANQPIRVLYRGPRSQGSTLLEANPPSPLAGTIDYTGAVNQGNVNITLSYTGANGGNAGWNLIPNPYPSNVDFGNIVSGNRNGIGTFAEWVVSSGTRGAYISRSFGSSHVIAKGSAVFVQTGSAATFTITEPDKTASSASSTLLKTNPFLKDAMQINVYSDDTIFWDQFVLRSRPDETEGKDNSDAPKMLNPDVNFYSLSSSNDKLAIDNRPIADGKVIPLGFATGSPYHFTFKMGHFSLPEYKVYLKDKFLNTVNEISNEDFKYDFVTTADALSQGENRFELIFSKSATGLNNELSSSNNFIVFPNPANNVLNLSLTTTKEDNYNFNIYNQLGAEVNAGSLDFNAKRTHALNIENLSNGVYFIQVKNGKTAQTIKFIK